jgi:hypothetical protein
MTTVSSANLLAPVHFLFVRHMTLIAHVCCLTGRGITLGSIGVGEQY